MATKSTGHQHPGLEPWNETELALRLLVVFRNRERRPFSEEPPTAPGAYALFGSRGFPGQPPLGDGRVPLYIGSTRNLIERIRFHRRSIGEVGIDLRAVRLLTLPTSTAATASYVERLLLMVYSPAWNNTGFGSRTPGARRSGRVSSWDAAYPGRYWAAPPTPGERAVGLVDVAIGLISNRPDAPTWPALLHRS